MNELLKQRNALVINRAVLYLGRHQRFTFSSMTRYEILRGLKELRADAQLARFHVFCGQSVILPISDAILDRAADLWAEARQHGHPAQDADLIIAATAMENGLALVTGNHTHFAWISGITIDNWRA